MNCRSPNYDLHELMWTTLTQRSLLQVKTWSLSTNQIWKRLHWLIAALHPSTLVKLFSHSKHAVFCASLSGRKAFDKLVKVSSVRSLLSTYFGANSLSSFVLLGRLAESALFCSYWSWSFEISEHDWTTRCQCEGVAFPTCVSVNEIVGHFSPLPVEISEHSPGLLVACNNRTGNWCQRWMWLSGLVWNFMSFHLRANLGREASLWMSCIAKLVFSPFSSSITHDSVWNS